MNSKNIFYSLIFLIGVINISCKKVISPKISEYEQMKAPVEGLTQAELDRFHAGDAIFNGTIFTDETGLGPHFIATSCGSCHNQNGKGHPSNAITRFGQSDTLGNTHLDQGGPQLQNRSIPGYSPEVVPDGLPTMVSVAPINAGLGFLAALTDAQILANTDPNDADGDGISGVVNRTSPKAGFIEQSFHIQIAGKYIGRFGKKGSTITILEQTASAFLQDIGITSPYLPNEPGFLDVVITSEDINLQGVLDVAFFLRTLRPPIQRNTDDPEVLAGKQIFIDIACAKCHIPEWTTEASDIDALSYKTFRPYTDLLLHDMGPGLDDGYTEGSALTSEWRTPALWGLGLAKKAQGGTYFLLHDGRARSIEEAIQLHGGEAFNAKESYLGLSSAEKDKLIKFLESL